MFPPGFPYEKINKVKVSDDTIGLVLGEYENINLINIKILDYKTLDLISLIEVRKDNEETRHLEIASQVDIDDPLYPYDYLSDFNLLISNEDFNGDGFYDHVGFYNTESSDEEEIRIYSGKINSSEPKVLFKKLLTDVLDAETIKIYFAPVDDFTGDNITDGVIGWRNGCGEMRLTYYDIFNSREVDYWVLTYSCKSIYLMPIESLRNIGDLNSDKIEDILIDTGVSIFKIVDIHHKKELLNLYVILLDAFVFQDVNGDNKNELIAITQDNTIYCINSLFSLRSNIEDGQKISSNDFKIGIITSSKYSKIELFIDGFSHGTSTHGFSVSLSGGVHTIKMVMCDDSGLIYAIYSFEVVVPENYLMTVLTVLIVAMPCAYYGVRHRKKLFKIIKSKKKEVKSI